MKNPTGDGGGNCGERNLNCFQAGSYFAGLILAMYFTADRPSKSASCVHKVAWWERCGGEDDGIPPGEVLPEFPDAQPERPKPKSRATICPSCMWAEACKASVSPRSRAIHRKTSLIQTDGTINSFTRSMAAAEKTGVRTTGEIFNPGGESTTFTGGRVRVQSRGSSRSKSRASPSWA